MKGNAEPMVKDGLGPTDQTIALCECYFHNLLIALG